MSAAEVVAQHRGQLGLLLNGRVECNCRAALDDEQAWAAHVLEAYKAAGYAVVQLPKPSYTDDPEGDGRKGYGFNGPPGDATLSEHGVYAYNGEVFDAYDGWTPAQARTIASWWLAAADAAEAAK